MTKVPWTKDLRNRIKRKWQASIPAEAAAAKLGCGLRKLKEEYAALQRTHGSAEGGQHKRVFARRQLTAAVAVAKSAPSPKRRRPKPLTAAKLNAEVRTHAPYRQTSRRTTANDVGHAGGRAVLRSTGIGERRRRRLLLGPSGASERAQGRVTAGRAGPGRAYAAGEKGARVANA